MPRQFRIVRFPSEVYARLGKDCPEQLGPFYSLLCSGKKSRAAAVQMWLGLTWTGVERPRRTFTLLSNYVGPLRTDSDQHGRVLLLLADRGGPLKLASVMQFRSIIHKSRGREYAIYHNRMNSLAICRPLYAVLDKLIDLNIHWTLYFLSDRVQPRKLFRLFTFYYLLFVLS